MLESIVRTTKKTIFFCRHLPSTSHMWLAFRPITAPTQDFVSWRLVRPWIHSLRTDREQEQSLPFIARPWAVHFPHLNSYTFWSLHGPMRLSNSPSTWPCSAGLLFLTLAFSSLSTEHHAAYLIKEMEAISQEQPSFPLITVNHLFHPF